MPSDASLFLSQFMRSPSLVGAVAPSSRALARSVTAPVPETGDPVVVELGPGTGPFTEAIQERLGGRGHHLAVEINEPMARLLESRFPGVDVVTADAETLPDLLRERGLGSADAVVSGLPWAAFSQDHQRRLLRAVLTSMSPTAAFTTFAYVHALPLSTARRFRRLLQIAFEEVVAGRTVWGNLPPAFVYTARRPRPRP
ncbi:methyltransferase domain-containing protein [Spongiactinospora sp. TRM90649]|uniref:class I SAM-dependent methyltransferase n=1 Tax=Spongiactinospora sp. TRM90649 TaxID=3031114 RepID=UPI0023F954E4|nr:methyltransferase domain-containing protein [Spongiactinospora sp. TRM90649]MDF5757147.1 methyltransferase domain-containing protein [Spongiactinospora sp. TRM90649]